MFCLKTLTKTYELSASDTKQRQEWTTGLHALLFGFLIIFDNLSGVLFVNCRESLKMFISLSSFPFFTLFLRTLFFTFTIGHCCCVTFKHIFFLNNASLSLWFGNAFVSENL